MSYTTLMPSIGEITIAPNPVAQNTTLLISIIASEIEVELTPEMKYSGEFYCGEV